MQKSLFTKYFSICASIILLSTTVLGVVLLALTANYFKTDKLSLLETNAGHAAAIAVQDYVNNGYTGLINKENVIDGFTLLSKSINADLFLVDVEGKTHVCTHRSPCNHTAYLVPKSIIRKAGDDGRYQELGKLGGIYTEQYYTVGVPMKVGGQVVGVVFASSSAQ